MRREQLGAVGQWGGESSRKGEKLDVAGQPCRAQQGREEGGAAGCSRMQKSRGGKQFGAAKQVGGGAAGNKNYIFFIFFFLLK